MNTLETGYKPWETRAKDAMACPVNKQVNHLEVSRIVRVDGDPFLVYISGGFDASKYVKVLRKTKFDGPSTLSISNKISSNGANAGGMRMSGIKTRSVTFGALQASPGRQRFQAAMCRSNRTQPEVWNATQWLLQETMSALSPVADELPLGDHETAIQPAWKIGATPFTSLIVNSGSSPYPYHKDSGNVKGSWSVMPVVRGRNGSGGYLSVPELGVSLACKSGDIVAFPGADLWHGVTPITGDRWSIVYYAKSGLISAAATPEEELASGQRRRTEYEQNGTSK